jgi:hypothetical protein
MPALIRQDETRVQKLFLHFLGKGERLKGKNF